MVAGNFDNGFIIKRYLGGGAFGKVFTAKQRGQSKQVSLRFVTTGTLKGKYVRFLYSSLQSESCNLPVMIM